MTRKEKFLEVIKQKGFDSVVDLMIRVESIILGDRGKAIEAVQKNKNYYQMIEGTREFPNKYIVALEKVLNMKFIDMIDPKSNAEAELKYDTLRTIAYANDYDKTKKFDLSESKEDDSIFHHEDEFGKYFIDYILEYSSINCLRYLLDNTVFETSFDGSFRYYYTNDLESLPNKILNLICRIDDAALFKKLFDPYKLIRMSFYDNKNIYETEEFVRPILNTNNILNSLFEVEEISINEVNHAEFQMAIKNGLFANMIINSLLNVGLKEPLKYENQLCTILNKSYYLNKEIVDYLKIYEEQFKINEKGIISIDWIVVGQVIKYELPLLPETPVSVRRAVDVLSNPLYDLEFKESMRFGKRIYQVKDGKLYLTASNNDVEYEMLKYMSDNSFKMIPKLYEHNIEKNIDVLDFFEPNETRGYYRDDNNILITDIALFLKQFHYLAKKKLGNEKVYLHNELTVDNVSLDNNHIKGVINWSKCSIGNPLDEILFVLVHWTSMSDRYRVNDKVLESIGVFTDTYDLDKTIKLGDELDNYLNNKINALDKNSNGYERQYETLKFAQIFVDLYKDKLNERE